MRTKNSIYNSITGLLSSIVQILLSFIAQSVFIRILGAEYLGLNGLFTNILTMLSFFELGIGYAIVYNLYKPISNNDQNQIKALMNFYRKAYNYVAIIIFIIGIALLPFINFIVGDINVEINVKLIYVLFLLSTISTYLIAYKRSLIYANQKNYIINIIHMIYLIALNTSQLFIIYFTKNYYLYLAIKIICQLLENAIITIFSNKLYPYLKDVKNYHVDKVTEKNIFKKVKALLFHKVGNVLVTGTDNIIISSFLGVITVGFYSNYEMITKACNTMFSQIITSTTASVGNLLTEDNAKKQFDIFKKIRFLNFWISTFTATSILVIIQPFIKVWVGEKYILPIYVVIVIVFNYFQKMQRTVYNTFKDSAGIWEEDKFVPLIESAINIFASIILVKIIGLSGVFLGTILSGLVLWSYSYPKFVYKKLFDRKYNDYFKETIGYILLFVFISTITYLTSLIFQFNSALLQVIINCLICIFVPNLLIFLLFRKSEEFDYILKLLKKF